MTSFQTVVYQKNRITLVSGSAGSAKTVFAAQFLAEGIRKFDEGGVFVTFEETPDDIRRNLHSLGWDIIRWETEGKWTFVDASPQPGDGNIIAGDFDLGALLARIEDAIHRVNARRVSLDSLGAVLAQFEDKYNIRSEMFRITSGLRKMNVTVILTSERNQEYGDISRYGVEEFVSDNVIILRNVLDEEKRRRTIEILKYRGVPHQKENFPSPSLPVTVSSLIRCPPLSLNKNLPMSEFLLAIPNWIKCVAVAFSEIPSCWYPVQLALERH